MIFQIKTFETELNITLAMHLRFFTNIICYISGLIKLNIK